MCLPPPVLPVLPPPPLIRCVLPPILPLPYQHSYLRCHFSYPTLSRIAAFLLRVSCPQPRSVAATVTSTSTRYRGLKKIVKLISDAEKKMEKSYNHQAVELLKQATRAFKGMAVSSRAFRSEIEIKMCTALSEMKQYVEEKMCWRE